MLQDARDGKIDIILTKSISRFARNTVDLLETIRELKALGIEVRFEKEKINSLSEDGELMLTLLASFAQEESRSISENVKWGIRKNFQKGIGNSFHIYGYRWTGKEFVIVEEEAEIVRLIYDNYLNGISAEKTEKQLEEMGVKSYTGGHFSNSSIRQILQQERYTGNAPSGGLDAQVAEGGANLSGGQRQRLCFARALLRDTPIYVFDEVTSNIDASSERKLLDGISLLSVTHTVIMVTHRLSALALADEIYVMDEGRVAERGTHPALMARGGLYRRLWDRLADLETFAAQAGVEYDEDRYVPTDAELRVEIGRAHV